jgi:hypothetical protein
MQDGDKGIIERANGERWLIEKGVGAISFWRYEGKRVLIHSPGLFCGVGSKLILPDTNQEARIWQSERLPDNGVTVVAKSAPTTQADSDVVKATALALVTLKYFDPKSEDESKRDLVGALKKFQDDNKIGEGGKIGPDTQAKLAEMILRNQGRTVEGLDLALALVISARTMRGGSPTPGIAKSLPSIGTETFIIYVSADGSVAKLADGSIWEVDVLGRIKSMLWLPTQKVLRQSGGLLNLTKGETVKAALLR